MKEENKKYNAVDFMRYHSGKMTANEMHALEKAALGDPFLADALEGYAYANDPEQELEAIRLRLSHRKNDKKVFSLSPGNRGLWWKVAAVFILIAGIAYLLLPTEKQRDHPLSALQETVQKDTSNTISKLNTDTAQQEEIVALQSQVKSEKQIAGTHQRPVKVRQIPREKTSEFSDSQNLNERIVSEQPVIKHSEKAIAAIAENENRKSEKNKFVMPGERSFLRSADTNNLRVSSSRKYNRDSGQLPGLENEKSLLSEVTIVRGQHQVTGRDKKQASTDLGGTVSGVVLGHTLFPKGGKESFDQYVKDSAQIPVDAAGNRLAGSILLRFTIDENGKPADIKILQSDCKPCEKEAVRLLENGPRWEGNRGQKANVWIRL